jgi:hypothetical protein
MVQGIGDGFPIGHFRIADSDWPGGGCRDPFYWVWFFTGLGI